MSMLLVKYQLQDLQIIEVLKQLETTTSKELRESGNAIYSINNNNTAV